MIETARQRITAKAAKAGWSVTEYASALTLKKAGVTIAVRFAPAPRGGEAVIAASWNHRSLAGRDKAGQVLRALDS